MNTSYLAIHWLKSYYWEPQTEQIPFQRDGTAEIRKEIKSKLRELASCLKVRQNSLPGSSLIKGKREFTTLLFLFLLYYDALYWCYSLAYEMHKESLFEPKKIP